MKPPNRTFASYRMQTCGTRGTDKLEFGGDAPAGNALRTLVHLRTSFGPLDHKLLRKLEFGGESPLTMRYGLRVNIPHPLGPSTGK